MKLLNKTSLYYVGASLIVFLLGSLFFFVIIKDVIKEELTEKLWEEKSRIEHQLKSKDLRPHFLFSSVDTVIIKKTDGNTGAEAAVLSDTVLYEADEKHEEIPSRMLKFTVSSHDGTYRVTLIKSLIENDALVEGLSKAFLLMVVLFLTALFFINLKISIHIWRPFYSSLNAIKNFDLTGQKTLHMAGSDILEFNELNQALRKMGEAIQDDYKRLKEFTENASHEIQTPLAIIQNKLEIMIQSDKMDEENMGYLQAVYEASGRLSRLNKSLLLLTKIENNQFQTFEKVNLSAVVQRHIANFEELIAARALTLRLAIHPDVFVTMHPSLADILVSNLFTNAIKHNVPVGRIEIELNAGFFAIKNTGSPPNGDPNVFFERFKKKSDTSESLGLGLSIVKKICEVSTIDLQYFFEDGLHKIELRFPEI